MSLLPLTFAFDICMSYLEQPIQIIDSIYTPTNGIDIQSIDYERTIMGILDPSSSQKLENIFGGNVSDGDIGISTKEMLYIGDQIDYNSEEEQKQSFVIWNGRSYRVKSCADWRVHGGFEVYLAERHVVQDLV